MGPRALTKSLPKDTQVRVPRVHPLRRLSYKLHQIRKLALRGKTNRPYLSGDSFAGIADYYAFGQSGEERINLESLRSARSIFVNGDRFDRLLHEHFSDIGAQVILTGNSDENWDAMPTIPSAVELWLCQNSSIVDSRVSTLPIGLENLRLGRSGITAHYRQHRGPRIEDKVLVPPMSDTNSVRPATVNKTQSNPALFHTMTTYMSARKYFSVARKHRFVLCLEGNGYENHRIWETLYQGNFPVMLRTPWQQTLSYLKLPILSVDSIHEISLELLASFLDENKDFSPQETPCLWIDYWEKLTHGA
jgi:hypothetical protein